MKTLTDLKRELYIGRKCLLLERYGQKVDQAREVVKVQTNAWCFKTQDKPSVWLSMPKASLLDFDGAFFRIYAAGKRPLTAQEQTIKDGWEKQRNKEGEIQDLMSDGSTQFYREQLYYKQFNAVYLIGYREERGMCFDYNTGLVRDEKVKGDLELVYQIL